MFSGAQAVIAETPLMVYFQSRELLLEM